jgi:hypothetical protein
VELLAVPRTLRALELTCVAWRDALLSDELWTVLSARTVLEAPPLAAGAAGVARRRSSRLDRSARAEFRKRMASMHQRSENLVHAVGTMAQDTRNLSVARVRRALATWSPCLVDRLSPISNATPLMECCRARGVSEAAILAVVTELVVHARASPGVGNTEGQTPLIIASARGLPRIVAFLLKHGADPLPRGTARFRAASAQQTIVHGTHSALEWTEAVLECEKRMGVSASTQRQLLQCKSLLRAALGEKAAESRAVMAAAGPAAPVSVTVPVGVPDTKQPAEAARKKVKETVAWCRDDQLKDDDTI